MSLVLKPGKRQSRLGIDRVGDVSREIFKTGGLSMSDVIAKYREPNKTIESRIIRMRLIDGTQVNGQVNLNRNVEHDRLSDLICNDRDSFLILFNATSLHKDFDDPVRHETLFVNKSHIIWASPNEDQP